MKQQSSVGLKLIRIASFYLMVSLALGFVMALSEDHSLVSVHSHLGLLGWAAMAITGIVYLVLPRCGSSRLATVHFWLHNIGLPIMMISLVVLTESGDTRAAPLVGVGSILVIAGLLAFTVNVFRNRVADGVQPS
jgi:cbb3-type cytochrome oxidase subunit 1